MAITIKSARVESLSIERESEDGGYKIKTASYSLISSVDKVLAKQSIGDYGSMKLEPSPQTIKALDEFMRLYRADVSAVLGLEE